MYYSHNVSKRGSVHKHARVSTGGHVAAARYSPDLGNRCLADITVPINLLSGQIAFTTKKANLGPPALNLRAMVWKPDYDGFKACTEQAKCDI